MEKKLRYSSHIDLANENSAHTLQVVLTGENKKVLEAGPASGYITEALAERGCRVTGIESDPEAAAIAGQFAERIIVGDIEQLDFNEQFPDERFDVVIYGDVLEHLVDPDSVLARTKDVLADGGYVVATIPNVAHASLRLSLISGDFRYTEIGLLDRTHLRFYTRESIAELFANAGFEITDWRRVRMDPFDVEAGLKEADYPPYLVEALRADDDAMTYQYAVVARPAGLSGNGARDTALDMTEQAEADGIPAVMSSYSRKFNETTAELEDAKKAVKKLQGELKAQTSKLEIANRRINEIEGSIGWRALNRLRPIVRRVAPRGSLRFKALRATARMGIGAARLVRKPFVRRQGSPAEHAGSGQKPRVRRLKAGCYGEHCWTVGGGTVHALQLLIPLLPYFEVELLLPPGVPLRDRKWYLDNMQIDIGEMKVGHYKPGNEDAYDVWLSVWNEKLWPAKTPKSLNLLFFPFVELNGEGFTHIVNSEYTARYGRERYHSDDMVVIPPHVNVDEYKTGPKEGMILHCSRFALPSAYADKAHVMMIQAFKQLVDRGLQGWKLVLAGATIDEGEEVYQKHLQKHAYGYPVEFATNLPADELRDLFARASVYWHATGYSVKEPAAQEHFGIVILEGMASGAVPVVFNSGGPPEIITNGVDGFLFDTLEEMVDDTWQLATDPEKWREMSRAARERAGFFSPEMVKERMLRTVSGTEKVSIIIGSHNNRDVLARAIESVLKNTPPGFELIVVDQACTDGTGVYLASLDYPHLKVIHNTENRSFAEFNNQGLEIATRPYILYLNDDVEAFPGWIEPLIDTLDRCPKVGAVGSRLLYPDGRVQHDGKMFKKDDLSPYHVNMGGKVPDDESAIEVDALTAACLMVRKELAGFSEDYIRGYYEDTDLCLRIKEQGHALVLHRASVLIHYHGMSFGRNQAASEEAQAINRKTFLDRWAAKIPHLTYLATDDDMKGDVIRCRPVMSPEERDVAWPISRRLVR